MNANIMLLAILLVPVILLMVLRINAALIFLSLCLGDVLVQFVGNDAGAILSSSSAHTHGLPSSQSFVNLGLLLLPVVLTALIMIHSVRGGARLTFNLLPAIGVGLLGTLLAVPLLSAGTTGAITHLPLWHQIVNLQTLILGASTLLTLLFLWMQRPHAPKGDKHGKHH